jgi:hypothetical protein
MIAATNRTSQHLRLPQRQNWPRMLARVEPCRHLATARIVLAGACWLLACLPAQAAEEIDGGLVQMVADAIRANYSKIRSAELTIRETTKDATVTKAEVEVLELPSGGVARIQHTPETVRESRVWLAGESVRVDRSQDGKPADQTQETLVRHNGVWTQHVGPSKAAWRRRPSEMPGMFPQDPRDFGAQDVRRSMADVLTEDKILAAEMTADSKGRPLARIVTRGAKGNETTYEFAADEGFLPTRLVTRWPDGSLLQLVEISYQQVLDGQARFPVKLVRRFFGKNVTITPADMGWHKQLTCDVTGKISLNEAIAESVFDPVIPSGTRVSDNIRKTVYHTAGMSPASSGIPAWYYTAAVVAMLFVVTVARRFHSSH